MPRKLRVQRSLCLEEVTDDSSSTRVELSNGVDNQTRDMLERGMATCEKAAGARAKRRSRARKEASAKEARGYYKQFAEATHIEWKSWIANEVSDLVDMRKVEPKNYVTGQWVLTIKTNKQGNFLRAKVRWVRRGCQDKQKDLPSFRFACFHKTRILDELPDCSQQKLGSFPHRSQNSLASRTVL